MTTAIPPIPDPSEDTDVLALAGGVRLTAKKRRFCWLFLHGETAGNAKRSYMVAFENPNENTASTGADAILKDPNIQAYLGTLREQALARVNAKLAPWGDLVEEAQGIVLSIMRGHLRSRLMLDAASAVLDRALGKPPQRLEHELLRDESRVRKALAAHAMRQESKLQTPARPDLLTEAVRVRPQLAASEPRSDTSQEPLDLPDTMKGAPPEREQIKVRFK
jgi:hypothetical protein